MRTITAAALFLIATFIAAGAATAPQDAAPSPQSEPQRKFLNGLVGEWDVHYTANMAPGTPGAPGTEPTEVEGTETVRAVGEYFIVAETRFTMMGMPMQGILQLGWIEEKSNYAGTWIDSMTSHLWVYEGALNDAGDTLTLRTEGPSMLDPTPGSTAKYKEVITVKDKDHRTFTSNIQTENGEWMTMLTAEYVRKK